MSPWDALPDHIDEPKEWDKTDWDNKWQRWLLKFKGWFAYGPRSRHSWAAWKSPPKVLFGLGIYRWEHLKHGDLYLPLRKFTTAKSTAVLRGDGYFPSVNQYWSRFHLMIQWPFQISVHWYWPWKSVPKFPGRPGDFTIKEMVYLRLGARYDKDDVYWFPSAAAGGDFV